MNSIEVNKDLVRGCIKVLNALEYDRLDEFIAHDYKRHCQATPKASVESLDDFKDLLREFDKPLRRSKW